MFYYLYQITNKINGKIYVGVHKTKNLDDGYMGSGKVIKLAIEKHGVENFEKTILEHFDDSESMYAKEKEIVHVEFLDREDTYNLRRGGDGGFDYINKTGANYKGYSSAAERNKVISIFGTPYGNEIGKRGSLASEETRKDSVKEAERQRKTKETKIANGTFYPKTWGQLHTTDAQIKKKEKYKETKHQQGENNSQFGKRFMWLTDGGINIKAELGGAVPDGFVKGKTRNKEPKPVKT